MTYAPPSTFSAALSALNVGLDPRQVDKLGHFIELLLAANERISLTSIRTPEEAWSKHVLDSLSLVPHLKLDANKRVVDVGAGGGLPGLVLAIACPELQFTLIDATGKKAQHIKDTAAQLCLDNVNAIQGRAEELACPGAAHREQYDLAVARALAPLPVLLELVIPFLKVRARFLAIKGQRAPEELKAAADAMAILQTSVDEQHSTPTGTILCLRKTGQTPRRYPRRSGEPKRMPLGK